MRHFATSTAMGSSCCKGEGSWSCPDLNEQNSTKHSENYELTGILASGALLKNRWKILRKIGQGTYGRIFEVMKVDPLRNSEAQPVLYAIKMEVVKNSNELSGHLPIEAVVMRLLHGADRGRHVPECVDSGQLRTPSFDPVEFVVMTLLGPSLSQLKKFSPGAKLDPASTALFAHQALEAVEDLHKIGYLHRDIKPGNFAIGIGHNMHNIYMIDYSTARRFLDDCGKLTEIRQTCTFCGTLRYCPVDMHKRLEYGRQHDFMSLFYSLIELRTGRLPWAGRINDVGDIKRKIVPDVWLKDVESEYLAFYKLLAGLQYAMEPAYEIYRKFFEKILTNQNLTLNAPFIWEPGHPNHAEFARRVIEISSGRSLYFQPATAT